jgi:hypothetical protein
MMKFIPEFHIFGNFRFTAETSTSTPSCTIPARSDVAAPIGTEENQERRLKTTTKRLI